MIARQSVDLPPAMPCVANKPSTSVNFPAMQCNSCLSFVMARRSVCVLATGARTASYYCDLVGLRILFPLILVCSKRTMNCQYH